MPAIRPSRFIFHYLSSKPAACLSGSADYRLRSPKIFMCMTSAWSFQSPAHILWDAVGQNTVCPVYRHTTRRSVLCCGVGNHKNYDTYSHFVWLCVVLYFIRGVCKVLLHTHRSPHHVCVLITDSPRLFGLPQNSAEEHIALRYDKPAGNAFNSCDVTDWRQGPPWC